MSHQLNKSILIVCEGESTEPNYFSSIRDIINDKHLDVTIRISPLPKNEKERGFTLRRNGRKRPLKDLSAAAENKLKTYEIADEFLAQPIRYVREAQMGLEDGTFDEVWAVFDKDGHPKHKEAFELANESKNGKKVNIAFSSISFEYWILLHFEKNSITFLKSQCREGDVFINCGKEIHIHDCKGNSCVCGYLSVKKYIDYSKGSTTLFKELNKDIPFAINNAVWLREFALKTHPDRPIYQLDPYVSIDKLVFSLLQIPRDFFWITSSERILAGDISFEIKRKGSLITIDVFNVTSRRFILKKGVFRFVNSHGDFFLFGERAIVDQEVHTIEFYLGDLRDFIPAYICYEIENGKYMIADF